MGKGAADVDEPQAPAVYRGATREDAERTYHQDARTRAEAGFAPVSEDWTTALGQHVLTVRYRLDPEASKDTLQALDEIAVLPAPPPTAQTGQSAGQEFSYMERHRGTEFEPKTPEPPQPARGQLRKTDAAINDAIFIGRIAGLVLLVLGLIAVETGLLNMQFITIEPVRPPAQYPPEAAAYGLGVIALSSFVAGLISGLVPGRIARGPWKGMIIGFLGLALVGNIASLIHFDLLSEGVVTLKGTLEQMAWNLLGAAVVRLALLPFFPPR